MKKSLLCLALAGTLVSTGAFAQERVGGANAFVAADGTVKASAVAAAAAVVVITGGLISNANGAAPARTGGGGGGGVDPVDPTCNGDDTLVDGVCIGNTVTTSITQTVTGTGTATITVPVTFTYMPTN